MTDPVVRTTVFSSPSEPVNVNAASLKTSFPDGVMEGNPIMTLLCGATVSSPGRAFANVAWVESCQLPV